MNNSTGTRTKKQAVTPCFSLFFQGERRLSLVSAEWSAEVMSEFFLAALQVVGFDVFIDGRQLQFRGMRRQHADEVREMAQKVEADEDQWGPPPIPSYRQ